MSTAGKELVVVFSLIILLGLLIGGFITYNLERQRQMYDNVAAACLAKGGVPEISYGSSVVCKR